MRFVSFLNESTGLHVVAIERPDDELGDPVFEWEGSAAEAYELADKLNRVATAAADGVALELNFGPAPRDRDDDDPAKTSAAEADSDG